MPSVSKVSPRIGKNFIKLKGRLIKLSLFFSIVYEHLIEFHGYSNYSYSQGSCALKNSALLAISFLIFDLIDEK